MWDLHQAHDGSHSCKPSGQRAGTLSAMAGRRGWGGDSIYFDRHRGEACAGGLPTSRPTGQVEEDHGVGSFQPDRQGGVVVPVDDPAGRGDQVALQGRERLLVEQLPILS